MENKIDRLFNDIKNNGYRSQAKINVNNKYKLYLRSPEHYEVRVTIGRNGEIY